jgi:4-amino-4-deoxy-L-arabinose transferase-like glycosyltransferase
MTNLHKSKPFLWTLFIVFCIVWLYMLSVRTLVPTDEGRYAEMAREMLVTHDWITTRLNGIKYFEKPPLQIWVTALVYKAFGLGDWQARLWTGLSGLLGIVLTAYAGRKVYNDKVGLTAGLVLASSLYWAALGHINTLDMGLSGMMTITLSALLIAQRNDATAREQRNWMLLCWAGMALAVLSKGLIGIVLPGAVLVLYTFIARDWAIWKRLHFGWGLLVFFAISAPWFVLVSIKNPEFPYFFFVHEHFQRFTTKVHHRDGPWYYFIPILLAGILPWLGIFFQSMWAGCRVKEIRFQPRKMLTIWAIFIFVFFSISDSKLPSYILPIFPALALLIALYLQTASRLAWSITAGLVALLSAASLVFAHKIPSFAKAPVEIALHSQAVPWVLGASAVMLVGALIVLWWTRQKRDDMAIPATLVLAITAFIGGQLLSLGTEPYGRYRSGLPLVPAIQTELAPGVKLYSVGLYDQTLPFYLRHTMILVEHADEMDFGLEQEPNLWIPKREAFIEQWTNGPKAVAITTPEIFAEFQKQGLPMRVVDQDLRRVVITNDIKK